MIESRANRIRKSLGAENTFSRDLSEFDAMVAELQPLIDKVWRHCDDKGSRGLTVTLKLKFNDFGIITHSRSVPVAVSSRSDLELLPIALLENEMPVPKPVRLLGSRYPRSRTNWRPSHNLVCRFKGRNQAAKARDIEKRRFGFPPGGWRGPPSRSHSASRMASMLTGAFSPWGARAGHEAIAEASEAEEARIARFSASVSDACVTTSLGCSKTVPGCRRAWNAKTMSSVAIVGRMVSSIRRRAGRRPAAFCIRSGCLGFERVQVVRRRVEGRVLDLDVVGQVAAA
jgi:impB/mucB/samB family C-terminal domain